MMGFNRAFFFTYEMTLAEEIRWLNLPTHRWTLSKFHRRLENCEGQGSGAVSVGIDCTGPPSTVNVGYSRDVYLPLPLFYSQAEFKGPGGDGAVLDMNIGKLKV